MKKIKSEYLKKVIMKNFSMSEELAKAIGTVVVQALTENAKQPEEDFDWGDEEDEDSDLDDSELEESSRDAGKVKEAEGPKPAPDLSEEFSELKNAKDKNSHFSTRYEQVKNFFNM